MAVLLLKKSKTWWAVPEGGTMHASSTGTPTTKANSSSTRTLTTKVSLELTATWGGVSMEGGRRRVMAGIAI
jgi:hypothetical protein